MFDLLTFAPGETIIAEGVVDNHLYILQDGTVAIEKGGAHVTTLSEKGTFMGEISAILGEPRTCSVVAETECDILRLIQTIEEMVEHNPKLTRHLLAEMARRIKTSTEEILQREHQILTFRSTQWS
ncbi:MAG: Crp/Fnr family transcriptional regulator [Opitutales bacterium]